VSSVPDTEPDTHEIPGETYHVDGDIVSSTRDSLTVVADNGERLTIQRNTVVDIDRPGDELAAVGTILLGLGTTIGVAGFVAAATSASSSGFGFSGEGVAGFAGFAVAGVGLTLALPGWVIWGTSASAAAEP